MKRRRKIFERSWLVSWAVVTFVVLAWVELARFMTQHYWSWVSQLGVPRSLHSLPVCSLIALAAPPVVYLCYRLVDRCTPGAASEAKPRRIKTLLYTWLASWAIGTMVVLGWVLLIESLPVLRRYLSKVTVRGELSRHLRLLPFCSLLALALPPVVYLSWQIADRFVLHYDDDDDEQDRDRW